MPTPHPFTQIIPHRDADGGWKVVPVTDGFAVPQRFVATGDSVSLDIEVDTAGIPHCRALEVRADDVTRETLRRVALDRLIKQAVAAAARMFAPLEPGGEPVFRFTSTPLDEYAAFYEQYVRDARRPRSGSPLTDDHLGRVAELYRAAHERGDPPTQTIADTMHVARSTAARWVAKAREREHLGASLPGQAGEKGKQS